MKRQRGGTILGFILGVVVGLGIALGVAIYVTKVPVPFMNKGQSRTAEQDAEETKKNKDWDPNAAMYGKSGAKPAAADGSNNGQAAPAPAAQTPAPAAAPVPAPAPAAAPAAKPEPKAPPAAAPAAPVPADTKKSDAKSADPLGDLAKAKAGASTADPFIYWVQVGAYRTAEDAESQRAKLSLGGIETKLSEREQSGRMVYRVRVGPFDSKDDAEKSKEKLEKAGLESVLVRVQR